MMGKKTTQRLERPLKACGAAYNSRSYETGSREFFRLAAVHILKDRIEVVSSVVGAISNGDGGDYITNGELSDLLEELKETVDAAYISSKCAHETHEVLYRAEQAMKNNFSK